MDERRTKFFQIGALYGVIAFVMLVIYFLIMRAFEMAHLVELHLVNFIILAVLIYLGMVRLKKRRGNVITYFNGLGFGAALSFVAAVLFAVFMAIYMSMFDEQFQHDVAESLPFGQMGDPVSASLALWVEIFIGGFIIGFIIMQILKSRKYFQDQQHHQTAPKSGEGM